MGLCNMYPGLRTRALRTSIVVFEKNKVPMGALYFTCYV